MKYCLSIIVFCISTCLAFGQKIIKSEDFSINTPFLEPEERTLSINIAKEGFISLAKNKGTTKGASLYYLEFRRPDLSLKWSTPLRLAESENILHLDTINNQVVLFTVLHNEKQKKSTLQADVYNKDDGNQLFENKLLEHNIEEWNASEPKGAVVRDFNTFIASGSKKGYVTPMEYRYKISCSPDKSLLMFYRYDFSKPNLLAEAYIFDENLKLINEAIVPIDNGTINHELTLSPEGNIYLLNSKPDGTVAVVYFDLANKESRFLEVSPSNSERYHFKLNIESELSAYISYTNFRKNALEGISISRFNFQDEQIDWVHFQSVTQVIDSLSKTLGIESKKNSYALVNTNSDENGHLFILEQRELTSPGRIFEPGKGDNKNLWKHGKGKIILGNIFLVFLDIENNMKWAHIINKNQSNISEEGLISSSFNYEILEDGIKLLYGVGLGSISQLNHVSIDWEGNILKKELPNEHNIILIRPYTHWINPKELVMVGKKGMGGKSSLIMKYRILP